jgi:peroxiredoxin
LQKATERFEQAGARVVVVVPHDKARVERWQAKAGSAVPVLCDPGFVVSCRYGVAFQMRIHTDTSNTPGTFVIGKDGVLAWAHVGTGQRNWGDRPTIDATLAQVEALSK